MDMDNQFLANDTDGEFIEIVNHAPEITHPNQGKVAEKPKPPAGTPSAKSPTGQPAQGKVAETTKPPVDTAPIKGSTGQPVQGKIERPKEKKTWQERLLPLMAGILILLAIYFFLTTFIQIRNLHASILQMPSIDLNEKAAQDLMGGEASFQNKLEARELEIRSKMELYIVTNRYHQADVLLMSGLWTRYLGFITGMVLAFVGAAFILGKLRELPATLELSVREVLLKIGTTSPGLILVVLGFVLILVTLITKDSYEVKDTNIYLSGANPVETISANEAIPSLIGTLVPTESFSSQPPALP
jgi:hypothetical protein